MSIFQFTSSPSLPALVDAIEKASSAPGVRSLMILAADGNDYDGEALDAVLSRVELPLIGGIFPQIVADSNAHEQGAVVVGLPQALDTRVINGLSDADADFEERIDEACADLEGSATMILLVDGLARRIAALVDAVYAVFGATTNFLGGGAGSLSFQQKPCLLTNAGRVMDAAIIGMLDGASALAVGHGWQTIDPDHRITLVSGNVIREIDDRNAFAVYREIVDQHSAMAIDADNFFEIAQAFPFGINKLGGEMVVRDPIAVTEDGALVCVGELSEGDFVNILTADANQLVWAAGETAARAVQLTKNTQPEVALLFDCISRALFMKTHFHAEVDAIEAVVGADVPVCGALVLGEIANSGTGYLEFYNKTTVVSLL
ncbi:FIST signal transduction protein [Guyparkeria sp.]|uniref:FIST signal transduction protein n=1 Tax=Guyparkeria sp. TaxID=2035736 RepID=UPI003970FECF